MRIVRCSIFVLLAVAGLTGCHTAPDAADSDAVDALDAQPLLDSHGRPRSLAFASPRLRAMGEDLPGLPWYAARRDARRAVIAGIASPTATVTRTYTVDRQSFHNNRPHHHYDRTTYRYQVTTGVK